MTEQEKKDLINNYIAAYNRFDIDAMLAFLHSDVAFLNISKGAVTVESDGIDQFRELALQSASLFSKRQQSVTSFKEAADQAEIEVDFTCVLARDLPNGMKEGEELNLQGRADFEFADGKIRKITDIG